LLKEVKPHEKQSKASVRDVSQAQSRKGSLGAIQIVKYASRLNEKGENDYQVVRVEER